MVFLEVIEVLYEKSDISYSTYSGIQDKNETWRSKNEISKQNEGRTDR
jgi:hypothetical protein